MSRIITLYIAVAAGIQLPGNFMISPIEVTTGPLNNKEIQNRYYKTAPAMRLRRGPVADDRYFMTGKAQQYVMTGRVNA